MARSTWNGPEAQKGYEISVQSGGPTETIPASAESGNGSKPAEFTEFETITRKLLAVPKSELNEKLRRD